MLTSVPWGAGSLVRRRVVSLLLFSRTQNSHESGGRMSDLRRRLFTAFVDAGGDLVDDGVVESFQRFIDAQLVLLPARVRHAVALVLRDDGRGHLRAAERLSEQEGRPVTEAAARQRVSRGARLLEQAIRSRTWSATTGRQARQNILTDVSR